MSVKVTYRYTQIGNLVSGLQFIINNNVNSCSAFIIILEPNFRNQNYRGRVSSPSQTPVGAIPSICIETVDNVHNTTRRGLTFDPIDKLKNSEIFAEDIVPLGHVSLELTKSSDGEKLILVRNSRQFNNSRRRSTSLSQPGASSKKLESLFGKLKPNSNSGKSPEQNYDAVIRNSETPQVRTLKNATESGESQTNQRTWIDQINLIHDYYQCPQVTKRRRVQSN